MTKLRVVVLLAVVALLLFPAIAFAQGPQLPCRFYGAVQVNGEDVADGTSITATIEGDTYTTATATTVYGPSTYALKIVPPEGTRYNEGAQVTFTIDGVAAEQTSTFGAGANKPLDLSIGEAVTPGDGITSVVIEMLAPGEDASATLVGGVLTLSIPAGEKGATGATGLKGDTGPAGEDAPGGIALPVVALVIAIIAVGVAMMSMRRRI